MEQTFILGTIRGGGVTKKKVRSLLIDAAGVVFLARDRNTSPSFLEAARWRLALRGEKRMLRDIFLIAREFAFLSFLD